MQGTTTHSY